MSAAALLEGEAGHAGGQSLQMWFGMIFPPWGEACEMGLKTAPKITFMLFLQPARHDWCCCSFQEISDRFMKE